MAVDYDLVILGGTAEGRHAAVTAAALNARVALVEPDFVQDTANGYRQALIGAGKLARRTRQAELLGLSGPLEEEQTDGSWLHGWAERVADQLAMVRSRPLLSAAGVDLAVGSAHVEGHPRLGVTVKDDRTPDGRTLRARAYLIATGSRPAIPEIPGLSAVNYLTPDDLQSLQAFQSLPERWVVLGGEPQGLELAQTFAHFGCAVTLIVSYPHILPAEDPETAHLLQAALEADGLRILPQAQVQAIKPSGSSIQVQLKDSDLLADALLVAAGRQPNVPDLPFDRLGIQQSEQGIRVSPHLRTGHPRFYACGAAIGGYDLPHVAQYEAEIAVHNALLFPTRRVEYRSIPWAIATVPELVRIGMTEPQARHRYGDDLRVLRHPWTMLEKAQIEDEPTGFCKLLVHRNGALLGAHVLGAGASEVGNAIALAMQKNLKLSAIAQLPQITPTWSAILSRTADQWNQLRREQNGLRRELREGWFSFRRSQTS